MSNDDARIVMMMSLRMAIDAVDAAVQLLRNDAERGDRALHRMLLDLTDEVRALRTNVLVLGGDIARLRVAVGLREQDGIHTGA